MQPRDLVNGRFEIDRLAGSGGMGSVYRAVDRQTGAPVAVKVIRGYSRDGMERFAREGEVLADLSHPGIVRFVASGVTPAGEPFLVMEWLEGEALGERLARGVLSVAETVDLGRCVAAALAVAHARGVVHRDLKPGNIFLPGRDLGRPKILDFGIARLIEGGSALTRTGMTLGSPGYVSPEQARGERNLDATSDVFSLACVLFTCLAGEPPFTGEMLQMLMKVVMEPAPLASSRRPDVPPALEDVLQRMLAKAPEARPRDAAAVAAALTALVGAADTAPRSLAVPAASRSWVTSTSPPVTSPPTLPPTRPLVSAPPPSTMAGASFVAPPIMPSAALPVAPSVAPPATRVPVILLAAGVGAFVALAAVAAFFFYLRAVALSAPIACGGLKCADYTAPDPTHVDPMEALPVITQLAQSIDRGALFCDMILTGAVDGTVPIGSDLRTVTAAITVRFGAGKGTRGTAVSVLPGRLFASESPCTHPAPIPVCTPRAAARAAVASGVPRGTSASMVYQHEEKLGGPDVGVPGAGAHGVPASHRRAHLRHQVQAPTMRHRAGHLDRHPPGSRPRAPRLLFPLAALALAVAAPSCGAAPSLPALLPPAPASDAAAPLLRPARYLALDRRWIERTGDGLDRVVLGGRRLELRGVEIAAAAPADPEVDGGARAPAWAAGGAARYVFWKGKQLWGGDSFMGALHPIAALPVEPHGSFDWLDGTGLLLPGGALVVPASGAAPVRAGVPALARAVAADARRAVAITALGHAWLTLDGGASYRDVSADLGGAVALEVRGDAIAAVLPGGRERVVTASGAIAEGGPGLLPDRRRPPLRDPDPFLDATFTRPIDAAVRDGLPLADGGVVIAARGFVGRLDVATLRSSSVAPLDPGLRDAECTPVRAGGAILLACVGREGAAVVDLDGAPRTERTFDLAGASDLDRFVASGDDALGYLGPCDGAPPRLSDGDFAADVQGNASRQRTPVFCVRAGRDAWVEHRLDPAEAAEVIAWIPRAGGGAVALLGRPGPFLDDRDRVRVRGALRVVRLARSEPPLAISPYGYERPHVVDRSLRVLADDSIVGWLTSSANGMSTLAVRIDARGHVRARGAPLRPSQIVHAGDLALAGDDDGRLWETVDGGERWAEVEPPPGAPRASGVRPSSCSPAGCLVGGFVRLGWAGPAPTGEAPRLLRDHYQRPLPSPPLLRLACAPAGPAEGRRIPDSGGFGYTPQPQPRAVALTRIASLGVANIPWAGGPQMPLSGDVDLAWVAPLDVTGVLRRLTVPIARLGLPSGARRVYELRVGYLLAPGGGVEAFSTGYRECFGSLLEIAGVTRPLGACAEDPAVGVDLGGRVVVVHPEYEALVVSAAEAPPLPSGRRGPGFTIPVALHEIHRTPAGGPLRGFTFGAGARGGAPVVVVLDDAGDASLAPIDPERGTLGPEERLRPLPEALLGSAPACAPRADAREARVVLPFEGAIGVDRASLRGVGPGSLAGVAVLRWSPDRACLDAVEIPVKDDRFDETPGPYEPHGVLRKIVARFDAKGPAALLLEVSPGTEVRQRLSCTALLRGGGEAP